MCGAFMNLYITEKTTEDMFFPLVFAKKKGEIS